MCKEVAQNHSHEAPDGGYGWVVVLASLMNHAIADGIMYSFGIYYVELLHEYGESKSTTSWVASIMISTTFCIGPVASAMINRFGCRTVSILGALIATSGLLMSLFVPSIYYLYFTIGICTGTGFGLLYLPSIVSVSCYFDETRAFATGIAVCGSGLGTFILAPLLEVTIDYYGWRGSLFIVAGLVLNCVVFGALFRPLNIVKESLLTVLPSTSYRGTSDIIIAHKISKERNSWEINEILGKNYFVHSLNSLTDESIEDHVPSSELQGRCKSEYSERPRRNTDGAIAAKSDTYVTIQHGQHSAQSRLFGHKDLLNASMLSIREYCSNPEFIRREQSAGSRRVSSVGKGKEPCCLVEVIENTLDIMNISLLKDPIFMLFATANFLSSIGFNVPYVYMTDRVEDMQISSKDYGSFLLALIGISNTIGRITIGYLSDRKFMNILILYNICLIICGLSTIISCFLTDYISMAVYCCIFGLTTGACISLTSVILVQLFGLDKLSNAFGLLLLFVGIASLIGPPITGLLYDYTGSYNSGFYLCGSVIAFSGFMLFLVPVIQRRKGNQSVN